jgi:prepilin-type N-terminal cleavage/methylation domain-containing protein
MVLHGKWRKVQKDDRGFTLLEIMLAVCIVGFGILAIASMQTTALSGTSTGNLVTGASVVAQDRMEHLIATPYEQLANGNATSGIYGVSWTVSLDEIIKNTATITVNVSWQEKRMSKSMSIVHVKMDAV